MALRARRLVHCIEIELHSAAFFFAAMKVIGRENVNLADL
jgi:hypothetical protein